MNITLNGEQRTVDDDTTLAELVRAQAGGLRGSAIMINDEIVPRSQWAQETLESGQRVEVITAVQGG